MGTRHLIAVQLDGEYKVAQYGQWDGYLEYQGKNVLNFLREMDRPKFETALRKCSFMTEQDFDDLDKEIEKKRAYNFAYDWTQEYPHLSRSMSSEILNKIQESEGLKLKNSISFAVDSLFCEWAYVIDLDKNTFEIYEGFNKEPLSEGERFKDVVGDDVNDEYYPVRKVAEYNLDKLPSDEEFLILSKALQLSSSISE